MSAAVVLSQLKALTEKSEHLRGKFRRIYPTDGQWNTLGDLSSTLLEAATKLHEEVRVLKESRTERAWQESEKHRSFAQQARGDLFSKGRLSQSAIFRRNIVTVFLGPKDSAFDSEDVKFRKDSTRKRCEQIRGLSPDGVISWAIAYAPTLWAGGSMSSDVFDCLVDDIEPEVAQTWPAVIQETLHKLQEDENSLERSSEYSELLKVIDEPSSHLDKLVRRRKRRRIEKEDEAVPAEAQDVSHPGRHIDYRCSEAPIGQIPYLGAVLFDAVQSSLQWEFERDLGGLTTDCLNALVPKNRSQDISFTLLAGHAKGLELIEKFQLLSM